MQTRLTCEELQNPLAHDHVMSLARIAIYFRSSKTKSNAVLPIHLVHVGMVHLVVPQMRSVQLLLLALFSARSGKRSISVVAGAVWRIADALPAKLVPSVDLEPPAGAARSSNSADAQNAGAL